MKIGIIGLGFVGKAVAWSHRNQELRIRDPKLEEQSASIDEIKQCDAVYVCVPTPMQNDGSVDDSYVRSVLEELRDYNKVIICKSTVPPGVYGELENQYSNIVHAPEFLTAANANEDYEKSTWVLIGGSLENVEAAIRIISSSTILANYYHKTDIATASLFKYIANSFLATKVTFMNEMYQLAKTIGIDWNDIKKIAVNDPRLGTSHWDVPGPDGKYGFGGACFPKDIAAIVKHANNNGIDLNLLDTVTVINKKHRQ